MFIFGGPPLLWAEPMRRTDCKPSLRLTRIELEIKWNENPWNRWDVSHHKQASKTQNYRVSQHKQASKTQNYRYSKITS